MKKLVVVPALLKAHVGSYTRKDGVFVKEHDDKRQAASPKLQEGDAVKVTGNVQGAGKTGVIHSTAPSGSFHIVEHSDGSRSSYHESDLSPHDPDDFDDDDDHDHMTKSKPGMLVRADMLKAQVKSYTRKDGTFVKEHTTSVQAAAAPQPGEVGHHEHATYGAYFKKGEKVKDRQGNQHEVLSHVGPEVKTVSGKSFHPTKLSRAGGGEPKLLLPVKKTAAPGPFAAKSAKWGGLRVEGEGHSSHFKDGAIKEANKHAERMNAVHAAGRMDEMHAATLKAAKEHTPFESLETANSDREDFRETSRGGVKAALHQAYAAGRGKAGGKKADAAVAAAHQHHLSDVHSSLEMSSSGEDFKDTSKWALQSALHHAFAMGHADRAKA